ncbi:hypothetical protein [Prosthecobacter sp.]|uniref:hypothetical protein n=1 Tax=Prosthecobacter sp. TaxID=1965333 RepID=UPI00378408D7
MNIPSLFRVLGACLLMSVGTSAQDALNIVSRHVHYSLEASSPEAATLIREAALILGSDSGLKARIESDSGRASVHDALIWAAARHSAFNQQEFLLTFPGLFKYAHILFVSPDLYKTPRVIYQLSGAATPEPRMLFGDGVTPTIAKIERVEKWDDDEGVSDWIGEYSFEETDKGPYLVSTSVGRETTGATSIRHVLGWVRIEATRLVPERFEAFDVPLGQKRHSAHLKITALPKLRPAIPPPVIVPTRQAVPPSDATRSVLENGQSRGGAPPQSTERPSPEPKTPEAKPAITREQSASTPWSLIVVLGVAAFGLL